MGGSAGNKSAVGARQLADVERIAGDPKSSHELFSGNNWYFRARKRALTDFINPYFPFGGRVLDAGCGDGWLATALPGSEWYGMEPDKGLREIAAKRGIMVLPIGAERLPFPDEYFDAVVMFDVLEHVQDDQMVAEEAGRVLKPGGLFFASAPLHPELWSRHDENCGHFRRYKKGELAKTFTKRGFTVLKRRFFMSLPLPVVFLARKIGSGRTPNLPAFLDRVMYKIMEFDAWLELPFGLTEAVAAKKC